MTGSCAWARELPWFRGSGYTCNLALAATAVSGSLGGELPEIPRLLSNLLTPAFGGLNDRLGAIGEAGQKGDNAEVVHHGVTEYAYGVAGQCVAH